MSSELVKVTLLNGDEIVLPVDEAQEYLDDGELQEPPATENRMDISDVYGNDYDPDTTLSLGL